MYYVEWLRVRNCMRILAIVLGALFVCAGIARVALIPEMNAGYGWVLNEESKPGVHVTKHTQSDGTTVTTIDDPRRGDHIVITDRGWDGRTIRISGRDVNTDSDKSVQIGTFGMHTIRSTPNGGTVEINTDDVISARTLFFFAALVALIVATILSCPLALENKNHLEVAWTKPVSRERMALGLFGVDVVGILISMALTVVFCVLCMSLFQVPRIAADSATLPVLALSILMPVGWYALLTACSSSLKRGRGAVLGLGWLAALTIPGIAFGLYSATFPIVHLVGTVLGYVTLLDPIVYMHLASSTAPGDNDPAFGFMFGALVWSPLARAAMLFGLTVIYAALSLIQWRRLEA